MLNIRSKIIQAPMAGGITSRSLVTEVSNNGGLGSIGAGYMSANALRTLIQDVKTDTNNPFQVNLFVIEEPKFDVKIYEKNVEQLKKLNPNCDYEKPTFSNSFNDQIAVCIEENVPIISFTFGIPSIDTLHKLKKNNIVIGQTISHPLELDLIKHLPFDFVIVQNDLAGGHKAQIKDHLPEINYNHWIKEIKQETDKIIVYSGGIHNKKQIEEYLNYVDYVQLGTPFLVTEESGAHPLHKQAIIDHSSDDVVVTNSFSGKAARGLKNAFIYEMKQIDPLQYPLQNQLTKDIRNQAKKNNNIEHMSLWCGKNIDQIKLKSVEQLMNELQY